MGKDQELLDAARTGNLLVIEKLLGGKPKNVLSQALSISFRRGVNPNCQDASGYTPLHHAVLNGHRDAVDYLLRYEASATVADSRGSTPVHLAAWTGNMEIMRTLLAAGITLTQLNEQNHDWDTCLHFACQYGHTKVVEVLLEYGVDSSVLNKKEETPLDLATQYGRLEAVELLIKSKPELLSMIPESRSLLHLAARSGHHKVVKVLLDTGCDINKKLKTGTALHEAAVYGKVEVVSELLHHDPPINVHLTDEGGETALDKIKRHSTIVAQDINSLIQAHLSGHSIPLPEQSRSPSVTADQLKSSFSALTDPASPYDNLHSLGLAKTSPQNLKIPSGSPGQVIIAGNSPKSPNLSSSPTRSDGSSSSPNLRKPKRQQLAPPGAGAGSYINMDFPAKVPPKKPARSSIGILLDRDSTEETKKVEPIASVVVPSNSSMQESSPSSANSRPGNQDLGPPLPERNYYDEDLAGEYTELRIDAPPPKKNPPEEETSMQHIEQTVDETDLYNTLADALSRNATSKSQRHPHHHHHHHHHHRNHHHHMRHSASMYSPPSRQTYQEENLYEDLASALSGLPRSHSAFSCIAPPRHRQPEPAEPMAETPDSPDSEMYELLSEATSGNGSKHSSSSNGYKSELSNNNSIHSSSETTSKSGFSSNANQTPVPPPRKSRRHPHKIMNTSQTAEVRNSGTDSSSTELPSSPPHYMYTPPPTPDHPPPSPHTALLGIHKIMQQKGYPVEYRRNWSRDSGKFSPPPLHYTSTADDNIRDSINDSYNPHSSRTVSTTSSRRLGSEDSPCGTDCSSETEILRPDESDPFAGLIYGSNRGSRNISLSQSPSAFTFPTIEKALANQERGGMAGENGSQDGPDSVFEAPPKELVRDSKDAESSALDENSEWAQIESIMASFGAGLVRESVYIQDFQKEFERMFDGPIKPLSVGGWLESLGVGQYENTLIANGFDNLDFMGGSILEEQDLIDMGIHDPLHRKIILDATKTLPSVKPIGTGVDSNPVPSSVSDWLRSLLLSDYIPNFVENNIESMDRARELWELELENVLEVHMLGHRKRILASLGDRRHSWHGNHRSSVSSLNQESESNGYHHHHHQDSQPKQKLPTSNVHPSSASRRNHLPSTTSEQSASLDIDLFKDYSKEVASTTHRLKQNPSAAISNKRQVPSRTIPEPERVRHDEGHNDNGHMMPGGAHPSEEEVPSYQWMHQPEVLIKGCCNYTAFYLGSSLIKEPKGTESTLDACAKLRKSASGLHKIPSITLAINYIGVKFIDSKSKMVITDHEICNISHVAQDAEDLKTFAYITKDGEHERWYCHVFSVKTVDVATEIILTLGQAFEIAYQMLLKSQSHSHRPSVSDMSRHDSSALSSLSDDTKL